MMKSVAFVWLSLFLCSGLSTASPVLTNSDRLERLLNVVTDLTNPATKDIVARTRPCMLRSLDEMDPSIIESVYVYLEADNGCRLKALTSSHIDKTREAEYRLCSKGIPRKPMQNMKQIGQLIERCTEEAEAAAAEASTKTST